MVGAMTSASTTDDATDRDAHARLPADSGSGVAALVEGASSGVVLEGLADALDTLATERDVLLRVHVRENVELVRLLEQSIRWRDGRTGVCPVCGEGVLDADWQLRTQQMVDHARGSLDALADVETRLAEAMREAGRLGLPGLDAQGEPHELAAGLREHARSLAVV